MVGRSSPSPPLLRHVYLVALCGGEIGRWRFLGIDPQRGPCWEDCESKLPFAETGLPYAWEILGECDACGIGDAVRGL